MKKIETRIPILAGTAVLTAIGYFLRRQQLKTFVDADGMWASGAALSLFTWFAAATVILLAVCAWMQPVRKKYSLVMSGAKLPALLGGLGAGLLLVGGVLEFAAAVRGSEKITAVCGIIAAMSWIMLAVLRWNKKKPSPVLWMIPVVCFVGRLILHFRFWSQDPAVLDYCFDLFALICMLCFQFELAGFAFQTGKNRLCVFFGLSAVFFGVVTLADTGLVKLLETCGSLCWVVSNLWLLLRPAKKKTE